MPQDVVGQFGAGGAGSANIPFDGWSGDPSLSADDVIMLVTSSVNQVSTPTGWTPTAFTPPYYNVGLQGGGWFQCWTRLRPEFGNVTVTSSGGQIYGASVCTVGGLVLLDPELSDHFGALGGGASPAWTRNMTYAKPGELTVAIVRTRTLTQVAGSSFTTQATVGSGVNPFGGLFYCVDSVTEQISGPGSRTINWSGNVASSFSQYASYIFEFGLSAVDEEWNVGSSGPSAWA